MKTIWKFNLESKMTQDVMMPCGADILCVQAQFNNPVIWASVDPGEQSEKRTFIIVPTGEEHTSNAKYIGTFQINGGLLVFHLFEATI